MLAVVKLAGVPEMNLDFHHNHYVPEWYQKRFMLPGEGKYWYLDLSPDEEINNGHKFRRRALLHWGPRSCFAEDDLYTTRWGAEENVDIEKFFFGRVDSEGERAVEYFSDFDFNKPGHDAAFNGLMNYMSVQKLRTPKGFGWMSALRGGHDKNSRLMLLQSLQNLYCAIWTECVWQIADAAQSATKFIISDHPVTVYNRKCFPGSNHCMKFNDPDIRMVATHTYFPLSLEKILILTNLSWVRNPYQDERKLRPNPHYFHDTIFNFLDIQVCRNLTEQEVIEINYITKRRALRYIAGAEREWLYPERSLKSTHWSRFGTGLLMMPEPREIHMGGEVLVRCKDGNTDAWSEYGHRPWQKGYKDAERDVQESASLQRFQAEWSVMQGPAYRGTSYDSYCRHNGPYVSSEKFHHIYLEQAKRRKTRDRQ